MSSIAIDLAELLNGVQRPGDFCTAGTCEIFAPGIEVEGVGPIALPLLPVQAVQLIAAAERAPYGRGEQTLIDTDVRRTWQIDASRVRIRGRAWARTLDDIVARAAAGLGVADPVVAELYKLLVYDEGSFFVSHRDTEKISGMFATLVIALPSIYEGGELSVRHKDREIRLDLRCPEPSDAAFAAFYADCVHEVLPVTAGSRLTLIYNLSRQERGRRPTPPSYAAERDRLAVVLRQWAEALERADDDSPEKLIYPLEHAYTPAGLSFDALKGVDAARAATFRAAAEAAGCDLHLALVSIEESGIAEHTGAYRSYRRGDDDGADEYEVVEVSDRSETLSEWRRPDGVEAGLGILPVCEGEVSPPDAFEELAPDDESFHEATGNEGASFERSYRLAALVLWPSCRRFAVVNQGGLPATLQLLADLTAQWAESGQDRRSLLWAQTHELSGHMLASWPMAPWRPTKSPTDAASMLTLLTQLGDTVGIDAFLANVSAGGAYDKGDNEGVVQAIRLLPENRAAELFERIVTANAMALGACADLLARATAACPAVDLRPAALALLSALPSAGARAPEYAHGRWPGPMEPGIVVDALTALAPIDSALAAAAADAILARPQSYDPDAILVPAVLALGRSTAGAAVRLRDAVTAHLRDRIAPPLAPPVDWVRVSKLTCTCRHCTELGSFLADPVRDAWSFKAIQADRSHLETVIANSGCDLDLTTLRRGSPHSLVCTKNRASYERRAQQRRRDLADLARLEEFAR